MNSSLSLIFVALLSYLESCRLVGIEVVDRMLYSKSSLGDGDDDNVDDTVD